MHNDPACSVRLKVLQTAGKMDTLESLTLLESHLHDKDPVVRKEVLRLLKKREAKNADSQLQD